MSAVGGQEGPHGEAWLLEPQELCRPETTQSSQRSLTFPLTPSDTGLSCGSTYMRTFFSN